ncbi:MAG: hypothetical protein FWF23_01285 [Alphaproteobacteria bacterium]|nr:hypothetical protein [Alphaproteobacteria bacterium]MCL2505977.1 hypothetical protein [Alphaproteobacteria bacterium]
MTPSDNDKPKKSIIPTWKQGLRTWWSFIVKEKKTVLLFIAVLACFSLVPELTVGDKLKAGKSLKKDNSVSAEVPEIMRNNPEAVKLFKESPEAMKVLERIKDNPALGRIKNNPDVVKALEYVRNNPNALKELERLKADYEAKKIAESRFTPFEFGSSDEIEKALGVLKHNVDVRSLLGELKGNEDALKVLQVLNYDPEAVKELVKGFSDKQAEKPSIGTLILVIMCGAAKWLAAMIAIWVFTVMFLKNPNKYSGASSGETPDVSASVPSYSARSFFRWWWRSVLLALLVVLFGFIVGLLLGASYALYSNGISVVAVAGGVLLALAMAVVFIRLLYALTLVLPISALKKGPAFKESYRMTKGYKWKIFWNNAILMIIFAVVIGLCGVLLIFLPALGLLYAGVDNSILRPAFTIIAGVGGETCRILIGAASTIYFCMVYVAIRANNEKTEIES